MASFTEDLPTAEEIVVAYFPCHYPLSTLWSGFVD